MAEPRYIQEGEPRILYVPANRIFVSLNKGVFRIAFANKPKRLMTAVGVALPFTAALILRDVLTRQIEKAVSSAEVAHYTSQEEPTMTTEDMTTENRIAAVTKSLHDVRPTLDETISTLHSVVDDDELADNIEAADDAISYLEEASGAIDAALRAVEALARRFGSKKG